MRVSFTEILKELKDGKENMHLVTYTISCDNKREIVEGFLKSYQNSKSIDQSTFLIETSITAPKFFAAIKAELVKNNMKVVKDDVVHVFKLSRLSDPYAGTGLS